MNRRRPALLLALLTACSGGAPAAAPDRSPSSAPSTPVADAAAEPTPQQARQPRPAPLPERPQAQPTGPSKPAAFSDPSVLADALVAAEKKLRTGSGMEVRAAAWAQQQAYRDLVAHPSWQETVRGRIPADLRGAFDANLRAGAALTRLTKPRTELPQWRIIAPPPADDLLTAYRAAGDEFGVGWEYLAAIHLVETRMGRIRGASTAGALGPMQFLPSTWRAYGEGDINDPHDAIRAAARYLAAHGAPQRMQRALWAYNHSDLYVAAIEAYASVMRADPRTYHGYYHWRVYYRTVGGDVILDEGYDAAG